MENTELSTNANLDAPRPETVEVFAKHPLLIRWTHWVNFPLLTLMIVSGLMIYWANRAYTPFIPAGWFAAVGLDARLAFGMGIHFFFMWLFAINGIAYAIYLIVSGEWRESVPRLNSFKRAIEVTMHDLGLRKHLPPQGKFNDAQRLSYTGITLLGLLQLITGLVIFKPVQMQWLGIIFGGYEGARLVHFIATVLFVLFFVVHLLQVARAGWNNFRSMVTGFEKVTGDEIQRAQGIEK